MASFVVDLKSVVSLGVACSCCLNISSLNSSITSLAIIASWPPLAMPWRTSGWSSRLLPKGKEGEGEWREALLSFFMTTSDLEGPATTTACVSAAGGSGGGGGGEPATTTPLFFCAARNGAMA